MSQFPNDPQRPVHYEQKTNIRILSNPIDRFWSQKEPWGRFLLKAFITVLAIFLVAYFIQGRYRIHYDDQLVKCIPDKSVYLIDRSQKTVVRGGMYAFKSRGVPGFPDGTNMLKIASALPGDQVTVNSAQQIVVNGGLVTTGLDHAEELGRNPSEFMGSGRLPAGQAWFLGTSPQSYDSRYFGSVTVTGPESQIEGRAYALF